MVDGHDCDGPVSVVLHDAPANTLDLPDEILGEDTTDNSIGIPVVGDGCVVHERKDGPLSLSRRAEVEFPLNALGEEWVGYVNAFSPGGGMQRASIFMDIYELAEQGTRVEPSSTDRLEVMTGYVGAVGADGTNAGNLTIFGPYNLLDSIPVGVRIRPGGGLNSIMDWLTHRFENGQLVFDDVTHEITGIEDIVIPNPGGFGAKSFSANRDTLVDVVEWIREEFNIRLWFDPDPETDGGVVLRGEFLPEMRENLFEYAEFDGIDELDLTASRTYDATHDGEIDIIHNNALYEMKPYNTLVLRGAETHEPADPEDIALDTSMVAATPRPSGRYIEAKATFPELVDRAGGEMPVVRDTDKSDPTEMENAVRTQLKEALDTVSGGTMDLVLSPMISPHDRIIAQPGCAGVVDAELPSLTYEVQRTAHKIEPNKEDGEVWNTEVAVSMSVPGEEIETSTTYKSTEPTAESDNVPGDPTEQFDAISYDAE